jgi:hypothetical protein
MSNGLISAARPVDYSRRANGEFQSSFPIEPPSQPLTRSLQPTTTGEILSRRAGVDRRADVVRNRNPTRVLNVDLDLVAKADLSPLLERFGRSVFVLRNTVDRRVHTLWLELSTPPRNIDQAVLRYAALVRRLPHRERRLWNACRSRRVNIGIQAEAAPHAQYFELSETAVLGATEISASVVITVYGTPTDERGDRRSIADSDHLDC